jgi:uncharacterized metal-binding protein
MLEDKEPPILNFLTPRQVLHRRLTVIFLFLICAIIAVGVWIFLNLNPESLRHSLSRSELQAAKVKVTALVAGMIACVLLASGLIVIAWLEFREIQRKALLARRDIWREIADQSRDSRDKQGR